MLPKELTENERLKAEMDELQKKMKEEIEAQREARIAELKNLQEELSAYGWEWQEQEAMEELARMESQQSCLQVALKEAEAKAAKAESELAAAETELSLLQVALKDAGLTQ